MKAKTAEEYLCVWDEGRPQFTIEMGGLGPGYEQIIHIAVAEMIRKGLELKRNNISLIKDEKYSTEFDRECDLVVHENECLSGISGAQFGAAKRLAYQYLKFGRPEKMLEKSPSDRLIQVSNYWPVVNIKTKKNEQEKILEI